VLYLQ